MNRRRFFRLLPALGLTIGIHPAAARATTLQARPRGVLLQTSPLAGFQYHSAQRLWQHLRSGQPLRLVRETDNRHDPQAVAVYWLDQHLGYLPRAHNAAVAQLLDRGHRLTGRIHDLRQDYDPWQRLGIEVYLEPA